MSPESLQVHRVRVYLKCDRCGSTRSWYAPSYPRTWTPEPCDRYRGGYDRGRIPCGGMRRLLVTRPYSEIKTRALARQEEARRLREQGETLRAIGKALGVSPGRARQLVGPAERDGATDEAWRQRERHREENRPQELYALRMWYAPPYLVRCGTGEYW